MAGSKRDRELVKRAIFNILIARVKDDLRYRQENLTYTKKRVGQMKDTSELFRFLREEEGCLGDNYEASLVNTVAVWL